MQHSFNVELAVKYGVTEAILISHLEYWIKKNEANNKNFFDGRHWTYNSIKAWSELFPYLSEKKIRNALKHLENEGLILTGNYNTSSYDRTRWYAFSDMANSILLKGQMEIEKKSNQNIQKGEPIPDIIPYTVPDNITNSFSEKKKKEKRNLTYIPSKSETGFSENMQEAFEDWLNYKKERRELYKETGLKTLLKKLKTSVDEYGEQAVIDMLTKTIAAGYQGPVWDWLSKFKPEKPKKKSEWDGFYYEGMFDEVQ